MTESPSAGFRTPDRGRLAVLVALVASIALLLAVLFMLVLISRNGLDIRLGGDINLADLSKGITVQLQMSAPVILAIPEPVQLVAAGPDGAAIPATLSFVTCSGCNGSMLPSRWNPWTGQIEWTCPTCGQTSLLLPSP